MIGFHIQGAADGWPDAARRLPKGTPIKFVDGVQRAVEAKAVNPDLYTVVRHHVTSQPLPGGDKVPAARAFFQSFVDESFMKIAWAVDAVQEWNEYLADSQTPAERAQWTDWVRAVVKVWREEYRTNPLLAHIDLILCEAAVGNNIPMGIAKIAHENPFCVLGYHPYIPVHDKYIHPEHWEHYSGRWAVMDETYRQAGWKVRWFFGEFGAVGVNGEFDVAGPWPNSLAASDGWRHGRVYDGQVLPFLDMMTEWAMMVEETPAWKEGRVIGAVLFTTGGGSQWKHFEVKQPEMSVIADHVSSLMAAIGQPTPPPPTPAPEPPPAWEPDDDTGTVVPDGAPRTQYARVTHVIPLTMSTEDATKVLLKAHANGRQSVGWSYDDAGIGALNYKKAILWGIPAADQDVYRAWYARNYPGTIVEFAQLATESPEPHEDAPNFNVGTIVDVSHWQGEIDWEKAKSAGVTDAYIKLTEGSTHVDKRAIRNANECARLGIRFGFYHFWREGFGWRENMDHFVATLRSPELAAAYNSPLHVHPPMLDLEQIELAEFHQGGLELALWHIREKTGLRPGIYTSKYWLDKYIPAQQRSNLAHLAPSLWLAAWLQGRPIVPDGWTELYLHQYGTADGAAHGAQSASIDVNRPGKLFLG